MRSFNAKAKQATRKKRSFCKTLNQDCENGFETKFDIVTALVQNCQSDLNQWSASYWLKNELTLLQSLPQYRSNPALRETKA